jgi:formyl-CoA transferase
MLVELDDPEIGRYVAPGIVPKLSATPGRIDWSGPPPGAHNDEVYGELLGLSDDRRAALAAEGIV